MNLKIPYKNVIHFTTGGSCCNEGDRIPGVWTHPHHKFYTCLPIDGHGNKCFDNNLELNIWHKVEIAQDFNTDKNQVKTHKKKLREGFKKRKVIFIPFGGMGGPLKPPWSFHDYGLIC